MRGALSRNEPRRESPRRERQLPRSPLLIGTARALPKNGINPLGGRSVGTRSIGSLAHLARARRRLGLRLVDGPSTTGSVGNPGELDAASGAGFWGSAPAGIEPAHAVSATSRRGSSPECH
jgi:hypothetical protein